MSISIKLVAAPAFSIASTAALAGLSYTGVESNSVILGIAALGIFGSIALAWLVLRQLRLGIDALAHAMDTAANGDLRTKIPQRHDEIGLAADSFNRLIETMRQMIGDARSADMKLIAVAGGMAGEAAMMAERNSVIAERMQEGSAATEQMAHAATDISEHAVLVSNHAEQTRVAAGDGILDMKSAITGVSDAANAIESASASVVNLSERITEIGDVAGIIREIADQTNLLALNAAIEAARAGEAGRGFAVVADEVRKLAEKTSASTVRITDSVKAVHGAAQAATEAMSKTKDRTSVMREGMIRLDASLHKINQQALGLVGVAQSIVAATTEQRVASETTAGSFSLISQLSNESQSMANNLRSLADQVKDSASETDFKLARFKISAVDTPDLIKWSSAIATGNKDIDQQHQILIGYINRLNLAMQTNDTSATKEVVSGLVEYTVDHFAFEERLMKQTQYPDYDAHKARHEDLLKTVTQRTEAFMAGQLSAHEIIAFLTEWLTVHIQNTDKALAKHLC
ncbi:bacteriohemerythrin [Azonexus hydrophilus]|uniref:Bacteriohemerythrin n=1 Tax=Azonexus hydrophilus TaxID=418702 RepID=A0ABZ2XLX2_9RHOO